MAEIKDLDKVEGFQTADLERFVSATSVLLTQGEHLRNVGTDTRMILFEGRPSEDAISIQAQGGGDLRQLIVNAAIDDMVYQFYLNWQPQDRKVHPYLPPRVERFTKGSVAPERKSKLYEASEVLWPTPKEPANPEDLRLLTTVLEKTSLSADIQRKVVDYVVSDGQYRRTSEGELKKTGFGGLKLFPFGKKGK